jgi:hypothetical protein
MIEAATDAMGETTAGVGETYTMIKSVGHAVAGMCGIFALAASAVVCW